MQPPPPLKARKGALSNAPHPLGALAKRLHHRRMKPFTPEDLLACYRRGVFPMGESRAEEGVFLVDPEWRCLLPLDKFHIPRRLKRTLRSNRFSFTIDRDFIAVMEGCAASAPGRDDTWINDHIRALYADLHARGVAHSVEARIDGEMAGGLYGVALGGAFFGESMFSRAADASKTALIHLVARLRYGGFLLLDAQFTTSHLEQFGAQTLPRRIFQALLGVALETKAVFAALPENTAGAELIAIVEH